jgi:hypothetical protein
MKENTIKAVIVFAIIGFSVAIMPKACSRPDTARQTLEDQGYTDVVITGWRPFMAGKDDGVSTGFEATSPNGKRVSGAVTGGFVFKGSTIRFD